MLPDNKSTKSTGPFFDKNGMNNAVIDVKLAEMKEILLQAKKDILNKELSSKGTNPDINNENNQNISLDLLNESSEVSSIDSVSSDDRGVVIGANSSNGDNNDYSSSFNTTHCDEDLNTDINSILSSYAKRVVIVAKKPEETLEIKTKNLGNINMKEKNNSDCNEILDEISKKSMAQTETLFNSEANAREIKDDISLNKSSSCVDMSNESKKSLNESNYIINESNNPSNISIATDFNNLKIESRENQESNNRMKIKDINNLGNNGIQIATDSVKLINNTNNAKNRINYETEKQNSNRLAEISDQSETFKTAKLNLYGNLLKLNILETQSKIKYKKHSDSGEKNYLNYADLNKSDIEAEFDMHQKLPIQNFTLRLVYSQQLTHKIVQELELASPYTLDGYKKKGFFLGTEFPDHYNYCEYKTDEYLPYLNNLEYQDSFLKSVFKQDYISLNSLFKKKREPEKEVQVHPDFYTVMEYLERNSIEFSKLNVYQLPNHNENSRTSDKNDNSVIHAKTEKNLINGETIANLKATNISKDVLKKEIELLFTKQAFNFKKYDPVEIFFILLNYIKDLTSGLINQHFYDYYKKLKNESDKTVLLMKCMKYIIGASKTKILKSIVPLTKNDKEAYIIIMPYIMRLDLKDIKSSEYTAMMECIYLNLDVI